MADVADKLLEVLNPDDTVILMEYLEKNTPQVSIAEKIKKISPKTKIFALAHLVPAVLNKNFNDATWVKWVRPIDHFFTFGHSLSNYIKSRGGTSDKISTLLHYVDSDYYHKSGPVRLSSRPHVIAMGNQMRNIHMLRQIVIENPSIRFTICQGVKDLQAFFNGMDNVNLIPYVPEDKLRELMDQADISLNVMHDTVGSNVITTSLIMGLAMVVSDVGSIRDYCDDSNSIFCNSADEFSNALKTLCADKPRLLEMRKSAQISGGHLSIQEFHQTLQRHIARCCGSDL